jgi:hypothetical protein
MPLHVVTKSAIGHRVTPSAPGTMTGRRREPRRAGCMGWPWAISALD